MKNFLIEAIEKTNGWVLVIIWIAYLSYRAYELYSKSKALNSSLKILDDTLKNILDNISARLQQIINHNI